MSNSTALLGMPDRVHDLGAAGAVRHGAATGLLSRHLGFGGWLRLHPAAQTHWAEVDRAAQDLKGRISGHATLIGRIVAWLARLAGCPFGPVNREDVPVSVRLWLGADGVKLYWQRRYDIPGRAPLFVRSTMSNLPDGRLAEIFPSGLGVTLRLEETNGRLSFTSTGFVWRTSRRLLSIPHWLGPGRLSVVEGCGADGTHSLSLTLTHPWFGTIYRLDGTYRAVADATLRPDTADVGLPPATAHEDDANGSSALLCSPISVSTENPD